MRLGFAAKFTLACLVTVTLAAAGDGKSKDRKKKEEAKDKPAATTPASEASKPLERGPKDDGRDYAKATVTLRVRRGDTVLGDIILRFYPGSAPVHVRNFVQLAESGFYDGTQFHRVIPGFMIQGGDPNTIMGPRETHGMGFYSEADGTERRLVAEFSGRPHVRGTLSMARSSDPHSASCQFFICVAEARNLNHQYTVFGEVVSGMEVADAIVMSPRDANNHPNENVVVTSATVTWDP